MKNKILGFVLMLAVSGTARAAEMKIAVIDMNKALQTVDAGKQARASLEKEFNEKKKTLQSKEEEIKKMTEDFKKQSLVLSEEAKRKKEMEIQDKMMKFRAEFEKSQVDIQNRERSLTEPILTKLRTIIDEIGNKEGYTVILEKNENNVLFSNKGLDLTDQVIKTYNSKKNG